MTFTFRDLDSQDEDTVISGASIVSPENPSPTNLEISQDATSFSMGIFNDDFVVSEFSEVAVNFEFAIVPDTPPVQVPLPATIPMVMLSLFVLILGVLGNPCRPQGNSLGQTFAFLPQILTV